MSGDRRREPRRRSPTRFRERTCGPRGLGLRPAPRRIEPRGTRVVRFELLEPLARSGLVRDDVVERRTIFAPQLREECAARLDRLQTLRIGDDGLLGRPNVVRDLLHLGLEQS